MILKVSEKAENDFSVYILAILKIFKHFWQVEIKLSWLTVFLKEMANTPFFHSAHIRG